jgi:hypothetical protein
MTARAAAAGVTVAFALGMSPAARADTPAAPSRADVLFTTAKHLRDAGQYEDACPKFAETEQLEPGVGVMLYLADCYQHTGHSANAWAEFRKAERLARDRNDKRADVAQARAAALEPKINRLTIAVPDPSKHAGVEVAVDGTHIPQDHWNTALPTDPGEHAVAITVPGQAPRTVHVRLDEGATLTVPVFEDASASAPAATSPPGTAPAPAEATAPSEPEPQRAAGKTRTYVGVGLLGLGSVGVAVGAGLLDVKNQAISKNQTSDAGTFSAVAFAVGGAAFVSAVVLYLTAPRDRSAALTLSPTPMASGGGAVLRGTF